MASPNRSPMTPYEESIAFYYELGLAIAAWANVERSLLWIVTACFTKHNHVQASLAFLSIENFRSKMLAADHLFTTKFSKNAAHINSWQQLYHKLQKLSSLRNHLVHYHAMGYAVAAPGRRYALIPTLSKNSGFVQKIPKPPSGSLCLRDIVDARNQFNALAHGLEFLVYRVKKHKTRLPASLAQAAKPPTMAQLTRQIRSILGLRP
jgi:hypothetical protein